MRVVQQRVDREPHSEELASRSVYALARPSQGSHSYCRGRYVAPHVPDPVPFRICPTELPPMFGPLGCEFGILSC